MRRLPHCSSVQSKVAMPRISLSRDFLERSARCDRSRVTYFGCILINGRAIGHTYFEGPLDGGCANIKVQVQVWVVIIEMSATRMRAARSTLAILVLEMSGRGGKAWRAFLIWTVRIKLQTTVWHHFIYVTHGKNPQGHLHRVMYMDSSKS